MSESATNAADTGGLEGFGENQLNGWWCYTCHGRVSADFDLTGDPVCLVCGAVGFLEQINTCDSESGNRAAISSDAGVNGQISSTATPPGDTGVAGDAIARMFRNFPDVSGGRTAAAEGPAGFAVQFFQGFGNPQMRTTNNNRGRDNTTDGDPVGNDLTSQVNHNGGGSSNRGTNNGGFRLSDMIRSLSQNAAMDASDGRATQGRSSGVIPFFLFDTDAGDHRGPFARRFEYTTQSGNNFGPSWVFATSTEGMPTLDGIESFLGGFSHAFNILSDQGFQNVLQFIMDNDPNRHGPPPTAQQLLDNMSVISLTESTAVGDCAICQEFFKVDDNVHVLADAAPSGDDVEPCTCSHIFHVKCIVPWLKQHNSCPVCRFELPTDDEDYERQKAEVRLRLRQARRQARD